MSYVLRGVIGAPVVLQAASAPSNAIVVPLRQGLCLLPISDNLLEHVQRAQRGGPRPAWAQHFPAGLEQVLADWSQAGPVAYVEAEYFGGIGSQLAAVWHAGQLCLGPLITSDDHATTTAGKSPISQALARLGVRAEGYVDEFDAVDLGRHRDTDGWLGQAE